MTAPSSSAPARIAVAGYAALDHTMAVSALPLPNQTAIVTRRLTKAATRLGGCAPHIARWLAREGLDVELATWLGDDPAGRDYLGHLSTDGVGLQGVTVGRGGRTPQAWLFYAPDGASMCFYDPGATLGDPTSPAEPLRAEQAAVVMAEAGWLCLTVGYRQATEALLAAARPDARVVWAVKADPEAFPPPLARRLLGRAAVVVYSRGERPFLDDAAGAGGPLGLVGPDCLVVETRGADPVAYWDGGAERHVPVEPVDPSAVSDPTGAGDSFLAGLLAHLVRHPGQTHAAVAAGVAAARRYLLEGLPG